MTGTWPPDPDTACRNCRRPIHWVPAVGWLHDEHPRYAHEDPGCATPHPVECRHWPTRPCPNGWSP